MHAILRHRVLFLRFKEKSACDSCWWLLWCTACMKRRAVEEGMDQESVPDMLSMPAWDLKTTYCLLAALSVERTLLNEHPTRHWACKWRCMP
ncbi:hypothetical protein MPH_12088 [Macrophomina phaseolina MS6]|uniref:Uncharacterized protein n=1 Tax=Macrophomina phaseolina (strain MS6) TaxID=1126212 RepID=K2RD29_MACPH|nr:hypothetical protein MPH_12088 [Macrophomina phaseolina MS6]